MAVYIAGYTIFTSMFDYFESTLTIFMRWKNALLSVIIKKKLKLIYNYNIYLLDKFSEII